MRTCDGAAGIVAAAPFATQVADSSQQGEQVERAPSDRASGDTYEMSDDDLVSKKTGAQVLVGPASTQYEGSTKVFIGLVVVAVAVVVVVFLLRVPRI